MACEQDLAWSLAVQNPLAQSFHQAADQPWVQAGIDVVYSEHGRRLRQSGDDRREKHVERAFAGIVTAQLITLGGHEAITEVDDALLGRN